MSLVQRSRGVRRARVGGMLTALTLFAWCMLAAQGSDPDVATYLSMITNGQADQVKVELPSLLTKFPNNPGVLYLQGLVATEGAEAARVYQSIVDNFPKSEWADDALYKVYQFYYALGLYRTAELKLNQLRKDYPQSKYARESAETDMQVLSEEGTVTTPPEARGRSDTTRSQVQQAVLPIQYVLQVGAYTSEANAEKQKLFFEDLGFTVEIINKVKENRSLFLVLVGNFGTYEDAKARGLEIRKKYNIESIVVSR